MKAKTNFVCILLSALSLLSGCESTTDPYAYEDRIIHFYSNEELSIDESWTGL